MSDFCEDILRGIRLKFATLISRDAFCDFLSPGRFDFR